MSLQTSVAPPLRRLPRPLDVVVPRKAVEIAFVVGVAICFAYVFLAVKIVAEGRQAYQFGDFFALWTSGHLAYAGQAAVNFDADALHAAQVALGMNPHGYNPFPYPPTLLLLLGPLGGLSLPLAFWAFMVPSFAAYLLAMAAGRGREWGWALGAIVAPATGITLISGQTGFLTGALMIGGLRLLPTRPALAGALFGLLACKPQLGVLVPVALFAAGAWRAALAAALTFATGVVVSGAVYGFALWGLWLGALTDYAARFPPVFGYMPTIYANATLMGAPHALALALQAAVSVVVAVVVGRAFRAGVTARAVALVTLGTFLATPHAFNYDMPMTTYALVWLTLIKLRRQGAMDIGELFALAFAFLTPFLMLEAKTAGFAFSWAPLGLAFCLAARSRADETPRADALGAVGLPEPTRA